MSLHLKNLKAYRRYVFKLYVQSILKISDLQFRVQVQAKHRKLTLEPCFGIRQFIKDPTLTYNTKDTKILIQNYLRNEPTITRGPNPRLKVKRVNR